MEQRVKNQRGRDMQNSIRPEDKLLLSREEAAALLSISKRAVDYLIADGILCTRRIASRVLIPVRDLERFARADHPDKLTGFAGLAKRRKQVRRVTELGQVAEHGEGNDGVVDRVHRSRDGG
jgi:hypothetical protein